MRFSEFVEKMQRKALSDFQRGFIEDLEERLMGDCEISMPLNIGRKESLQTISLLNKSICV